MTEKELLPEAEKRVRSVAMEPSDLAKIFEQQTNALLYNLRPDVIEKRKRDSEFVQNCPNVEWEREMGFSVPVCSIDGQYCNRQCRQPKGCNQCM